MKNRRIIIKDDRNFVCVDRIRVCLTYALEIPKDEKKVKAGTILRLSNGNSLGIFEERPLFGNESESRPGMLGSVFLHFNGFREARKILFDKYNISFGEDKAVDGGSNFIPVSVRRKYPKEVCNVLQHEVPDVIFEKIEAVDKVVCDQYKRFAPRRISKSFVVLEVAEDVISPWGFDLGTLEEIDRAISPEVVVRQSGVYTNQYLKPNGRIPLNLRTPERIVNLVPFRDDISRYYYKGEYSDGSLLLLYCKSKPAVSQVPPLEWLQRIEHKFVTADQIHSIFSGKKFGDKKNFRKFLKSAYDICHQRIYSRLNLPYSLTHPDSRTRIKELIRVAHPKNSDLVISALLDDGYLIGDEKISPFVIRQKLKDAKDMGLLLKKGKSRYFLNPEFIAKDLKANGIANIDLSSNIQTEKS